MTEDDFLWNYYREHTDQARQHETQRQLMTGAVISLGAAITAAVKATSISSEAAGNILIAIGIMGWLLSRKHYERNRFHTGIAGKIRKLLESRLAQASSNPLPPHTISGTREHVESTQHGKYPVFSRLPLHVMWEALPLAVAGIGGWLARSQFASMLQ